jgi:aryl-alcohol dehydrogenase-like predicted oxidoreductase
MTANAASLRDVYPLCLGGNVFGWTMDEPESFAVLDAYAAAGGNFVDTADVYSVWAEGNGGGESETIIGNWMAARRNRDEIVVATKVGQLTGVSAREIREGVDASLRRLQTDRIDLYYTHADDPDVPLEETLGALDELVRAGKVLHIGAASSLTAARLEEALAVSDREGFARYEALQPHFNLIERDAFEGPLAELCERERLVVFPFFALARGFLTGKYRPGQEADTRRGMADPPGEDRAQAVLGALDEVAAAEHTTVAAVSLAWLAAQPSVRAPIASARTPAQLAELVPMATLELSPAELDQLARAAA